MDADHSREPWRVGGIDGSSGCGPCIVSDHGVNPAWGADDVFYYGGHLVADSVCLPDARRIVAAVNACDGIPTDELEMLVRAGKRLTAPASPSENELKDGGTREPVRPLAGVV